MRALHLGSIVGPLFFGNPHTPEGPGSRAQLPYMVWFLGPHSIVALYLDPLGSSSSPDLGERRNSGCLANYEVPA